MKLKLSEHFNFFKETEELFNFNETKMVSLLNPEQQEAFIPFWNLRKVPKETSSLLSLKETLLFLDPLEPGKELIKKVLLGNFQTLFDIKEKLSALEITYPEQDCYNPFDPEEILKLINNYKDGDPIELLQEILEDLTLDTYPYYCLKNTRRNKFFEMNEVSETEILLEIHKLKQFILTLKDFEWNYDRLFGPFNRKLLFRFSFGNPSYYSVKKIVSNAKTPEEVIYILSVVAKRCISYRAFKFLAKKAVVYNCGLVYFRLCNKDSIKRQLFLNEIRYFKFD